MLPTPISDINYFIIIGLDPGSDTFGISIMKIGIEKLDILETLAWTVSGKKLSNGDFVSTIHGDRVGRIYALNNYLLDLFNAYSPFIIATESPFINSSFPQAGIALTEVLAAIRNAVYLYDRFKELHLVPPSLVKNAIGAKGNGDKDAVKNSLLKITCLNYNGTVAMSDLDEHSIDAIAVAYSRYVLLTQSL